MDPPHLVTEINSPELLEHYQSGHRHRTVLPETPLRLVFAPASAFFRRHVR
jgi:hypothetical protein